MALQIQPTLSPKNDSISPTVAEVNLGVLAQNFKAIRVRVAPARTMLIVKANAYGHGMIEVARRLEAESDSLGVALLAEGIDLRRAGIVKPILVFGGFIPEQVLSYIQYGISFSVSSVHLLEEIDQAAQALRTRASVHLKIDTGMGRMGAQYFEAEPLLAAALNCRSVNVDGIYSHFANADAPDLIHARLQLERFNEVLGFYERHSLPAPVRHMANSAAILQLPESYLDMVRPGILFYGYPPVPGIVDVKPALVWKSRIVNFKRLPAHYPVSYGSTWQSDHPVNIATIPVGYGDGYFRLLSNKGRVIVNGKSYPQVGRVCMDQLMINLEDDAAQIGAEVTLLGESFTADDLAGLIGTISYEVLTNIGARVPRVYVG